MPTPNPEPDVTLSILDRLTDSEPHLSREVFVSGWERQRQLRNAVLRDVGNLLNTRRSEEEPSQDLEQTRNSVCSYGLPEMTSYNLGDPAEQERIRHSIERAIRQFEPRLARVSVTLDYASLSQPALQFQVDAFLRIEPSPKPIRFDAALQRDARRFALADKSE